MGQKLIASTLIMFGWASAAIADVSLPYGGRLADAKGKPRGTSVDLEFRFFHQPTGGSPAAGVVIDHDDVVLNDGVFQRSLTLSDANAHIIFATGQAVWIEVKDATNGVTYPRQQFGVVPFALKVPVDNTTIVYNTQGELEIGSVPSAATAGHATTADSATTAAQINGIAVQTGTPSDNEVLAYNDSLSRWVFVPATPPGGGETNTGSSLGGDAAIFKAKSIYDLQFRGITAGAGIDVTQGANDVTIAAELTSVAGRTGAVTLTADDVAETAAKKWLTATQQTNWAATHTSVSTNAANWSAAHGWGNHASAGYLNGASSLPAANLTGTIDDARIPAGIARDAELPGDTDDLAEGATNKYFSNTLARNAVSGTAPVAYNATTGVFSMSAANGSTNGYLSSVNWTTFNDKQAAITATTDVTLDQLIAKGDIRLDDDDATAGVTIKANDTTTASYTVTLPAAAPVSNGLLLSIGTTGQLSWVSPGPGGDMMVSTYGSGGTGTVNDSDKLGGQAPSYYLNPANTAVDATHRYATDAEKTTWNTAAGWGNHASAGYLTGASSLPAANLTGTIDDARIPAGIARDAELPTDTDDLPQGSTNLYFSNALARAAISVNSPIVYNSTTGALDILEASGVSDGYLTSADYLRFGNKQDSITASSDITLDQLIAKGDVRLDDDDASAGVTIRANNTTTASYTLSLPAAGPVSNGQLLSVDTSGQLSWTTPGGGGDMLASVYGSGGTGTVNDSDKLGGQAASYYLNPANTAVDATHRYATDAEKTTWNTAAGWGNHASAGYLTGASSLPAANLTGTIDDARIPAAIARDSEIAAAARGAISSAGDPLNYSSGTGVFSIDQASIISDGYLSAADWDLFKDASDAVTAGATNWDTAHADRLKWDGSNSGLNVTTAKASLGYGTMADQNASAVAITGGTIAGVTLTTPSFGNDAISGDKVDGGTISNFASTGIDDNASATAMTIASSGNVGVGDSTPTRAKLEVNGMVGNTSAIFGGDGAGIAFIRDWPEVNFNLYYDAGVKSMSSGYGGALEFDPFGGHFIFRTSNSAATGADQAATMTSRFAIQNGGRIGVGTEAPTARMHVSDEGDATLAMTNTATSQYSSAQIRLENSEVTDENRFWRIFAEKSSAGADTGGSNLQIRRTNEDQTKAVTPIMVDASNNVIFNAGWTAGGETYGNVGIGTASPSAPLHVSTTTNPALIIEQTSGANSAALQFDDTTSHAWRIAQGAAAGDGKFVVYDVDQGAFRLVIDTTGRTGIGTLTPSSIFHIAGANPLLTIQPTSGANQQSGIQFITNTGGSGISIGRDLGNNGTNDFFIFDQAAAADRLYVDSTGNVGIGTTSPGYKLHVNGSAGKPGGGSWTAASDGRLKDVHGPYSLGLDAVMGIRPVSYNYKPGNTPGLPSEETYIGVIAQELQQHIPDAVQVGSDGYLTVNNDPVIWALVNSVQDLKRENDALKAYLCEKDPAAPICE